MPSHPQEEPLDLSTDVGRCRTCHRRRVLCAFGQCVGCHHQESWGRVPQEEPRHLCCGWYATASFPEIWVCPSCGMVHGPG